MMHRPNFDSVRASKLCFPAVILGHRLAPRRSQPRHATPGQPARALRADRSSAPQPPTARARTCRPAATCSNSAGICGPLCRSPRWSRGVPARDGTNVRPLLRTARGRRVLHRDVERSQTGSRPRAIIPTATKPCVPTRGSPAFGPIAETAHHRTTTGHGGVW
jgi:hypothetical protein